MARDVGERPALRRGHHGDQRVRVVEAPDRLQRRVAARIFSATVARARGAAPRCGPGSRITSISRTSPPSTSTRPTPADARQRRAQHELAEIAQPPRVDVPGQVERDDGNEVVVSRSTTTSAPRGQRGARLADARLAPAAARATCRCRARTAARARRRRGWCASARARRRARSRAPSRAGASASPASPRAARRRRARRRRCAGTRPRGRCRSAGATRSPRRRPPAPGRRARSARAARDSQSII